MTIFKLKHARAILSVAAGIPLSNIAQARIIAGYCSGVYYRDLLFRRLLSRAIVQARIVAASPQRIESSFRIGP
jgi:hypothetical protein